MRNLAVMFALALITIACDQQSTRLVSMTGEVLEVRITTSNGEVSTQDPSGGAMAGAVVGGMVAGKLGAVAGAGLGAGAANSAASGKILGCMVIMRAQDGVRVSFLPTSEKDMVYCSLLRNGDRLPELSKQGSNDYLWERGAGIHGTILP